MEGHIWIDSSERIAALGNDHRTMSSKTGSRRRTEQAGEWVCHVAFPLSMLSRYFLQSFRSSLSLAFASATVCHCMLLW